MPDGPDPPGVEDHKLFLLLLRAEQHRGGRSPYLQAAFTVVPTVTFLLRSLPHGRAPWRAFKVSEVDLYKKRLS